MWLVKEIKNNKRAYRDQLLLILLLGSAMGLVSCIDCLTSVKRTLVILTYTISVWLFLWMGNGLLSNYLSEKFSWLESPLKRLIIGILAMLLYTVGVMLLLLSLYKFNGLINFSDYQTPVIWALFITIFISLILHARGFLLAWRELAVQTEKLKKETVVSQYESLKNQVNPHFLFNALNSLTNLVYENQDEAARFIKQLSKVYRYVLENKDKELVSLSEEWDFVESYLFLEKIRYGKKLIIDKLFDQHQPRMIAPLSLQILIENAIKHNEISAENPLTVRLQGSEGYLIVSNNLQKKDYIGSSTGIGLQNIKDRYRFIDPARQVFIQSANGCFTVKIPLIDAS